MAKPDNRADEIMAKLSEAASTTSEDIVEAIVGNDDYAASPFVIRSAEGGTIFRGVSNGDESSEAGPGDASNGEAHPTHSSEPAAVEDKPEQPASEA